MNTEIDLKFFKIVNTNPSEIETESQSAFMSGDARPGPSRPLLPPISTLMDDFPTLDVLLDARPREDYDAQDSGVKKPQYTLADDLQILNTIKGFYGTAFQGRVPWSFWQTFRKATNSNRSSSSLYHHWNGAMRRKYGAFLTQGKLDECIVWIEQALENGKTMPRKTEPPAGHPLAHNWSLPPIPIRGTLPCQPLPPGAGSSRTN